MEIINQASEKFKDKQEEICGLLFPFLRKVTVLEKETYERSQKLREQNAKLGISPSQVGPGEKELKAEYRQRMGEIVKAGFCTEKLLSRGYGSSLANPQKYGYIDEEDSRAEFIMKTAKKATVITHFDSLCMHKFVLKDVDGKWLLDEIYSGFENAPEKWYANDIR